MEGDSGFSKRLDPQAESAISTRQFYLDFVPHGYLAESYSGVSRKPMPPGPNVVDAMLQLEANEVLKPSPSERSI